MELQFKKISDTKEGKLIQYNGKEKIGLGQVKLECTVFFDGDDGDLDEQIERHKSEAERAIRKVVTGTEVDLGYVGAEVNYAREEE